MAYVYLIGTDIFTLIWIILFFIRKDLRRKMFFTSLFAAPLGISEILFIPDYWIPQFQTIPIFKELFLESILFCSMVFFPWITCKLPIPKFVWNFDWRNTSWRISLDFFIRIVLDTSLWNLEKIFQKVESLSTTLSFWASPNFALKFNPLESLTRI